MLESMQRRRRQTWAESQRTILSGGNTDLRQYFSMASSSHLTIRVVVNIKPHQFSFPHAHNACLRYIQIRWFSIILFLQRFTGSSRLNISKVILGRTIHGPEVLLDTAWRVSSRLKTSYVGVIVCIPILALLSASYDARINDF